MGQILFNIPNNYSIVITDRNIYIVVNLLKLLEGVVRNIEDVNSVSGGYLKC
jgi:hypothetical protein